MTQDRRASGASSRHATPCTLRRDLWLISALALLFGAASAMLTTSPSDLVSFACSFGPSVTVAAATLVRSRRSCGRARLMWLFFGIGMTCNAFGDLFFEYIVATQNQLPALSMADAGYLLTYPFLFAGVAVMVAERSHGSIRNILVDASTVALVAGLAIWQFLVVNPGLTEEGPILQRIVFSSYPLMDVLIIGALIGLLLSPGRRTKSAALMAGFMLAFLTNDVFYNLIQAAGANDLVRFSDAGYNVAYWLLAAAAIHRSAGTLEADGSRHRRDASRPRMALLGIALVGAPAMAVVTPQLGFHYQAVVYVVSAVVVSVLVLSRLISLVRSLDREQRRLEKAEARLAHQAHHDGLTGLANRVLLLDELNRAIAPSELPHRELVVLFIDLDRFKGVNDRLGHRAGDQLLRTCGERIRACSADTDLVGRLGGDEFVVVCHDTPVAAVAQLAERILESLSAPIALGNDVVAGYGSVGIARYDAQLDASALLRDADLALYEAKAAGGRCARVFDETMRAGADERQDIERGLRWALKVGALDLAYQPLRSLRSNAVLGVEALLRWPGRPELPISKAIEVAESCGLIGELGDWVLRRACRDITRLNRGLETPISVSVNVSVLQLTRPDYAAEVRSTLRECHMDPATLTLELTETFLADDPAHAAQTLSELRALAVRLEIDDFGVGYSSLSRLSTFAIDGLKIDRSFTAGLGHDSTATSVVSAIIALTTSLNLTVTAEGVETGEQETILNSLGCDFAQGYYFAKPMPLDELESQLRYDRLVASAS